MQLQLHLSDWFLVGNGGMGFWDYCKGTLRDYHRDPFLHSLLRTRELCAWSLLRVQGEGWNRPRELCPSPFLFLHLTCVPLHDCGLINTCDTHTRICTCMGTNLRRGREKVKERDSKSAFVCVCMSVCLSVSTYIHTCMHVCSHEYMHTYMRECMQSCKHA